MTESSELFDSEISERMDQLLTLGYIDSEVEFLPGESFGLRTLTGEEELLASLVAKPYLDSFGQIKAWGWANVGLALTHYNGDGDFCPPTGSDLQAFAHLRFRYVTRKWYWPVGEFLFEQFKALEAERDDLIEALKGKSERSPRNFSGLRDSLSVPADSETTPEILEHLDD